MAKETTMAVRLDGEMMASLQKHAKAMDVPMSQIIRKAIRAELVRLKKRKISA